MQDEQQISEQPAEIPPETAAPVAATNGKKGGKQTAEKPAPTQDGQQFSAMNKRFDSLDRRFADLDKTAKQTSVTAIGIERSLDSRLGGITDDVEAMRALVLDMDKRFKALELERGNADARLLDAVRRHEGAVMKSLEATIAACEAMTGMRAEDRKIVRKFTADLRAIREGNGQQQAQTAPFPASHLPAWANVWTAVVGGTGVVCLLAWLLLS